jgi:hypothetical protein
MKIGLVDVDYHSNRSNTVYPNLALCKIAAYHKQKGNTVEFALPFEHYDVLYKSKIFNFSPDDDRAYFADKVIKGGTGYDIHSQLPQEIDDMQPDFSIYSNLDKNTSYGFLTRGCPNKCAWCVVPHKEGAIKPYWDIDRIANGRKNIVLMDNNILAAGDYCIEQLNKIIKRGYRIDFNQALDARLVTEDKAKLLAKVKWIMRIRFGCDTIPQVRDCIRAIELINSYGYHGEYFLYTMVGGRRKDNETEYEWNKRLFKDALDRITIWADDLQNNKKYNAYPHTQPYRDTERVNEIPQWQKDLARWCNRKELIKTTTFENYEPRKGFKCKEYIQHYRYEQRRSISDTER